MRGSIAPPSTRCAPAVGATSSPCCIRRTPPGTCPTSRSARPRRRRFISIACWPRLPPSSSRSAWPPTLWTSSTGDRCRRGSPIARWSRSPRSSLAGAIAIGIAGVFIFSPTLAPFVVVGGFLVVAYNLELAGGRFHTDFWFAAAWGAFPALTSWWVNTLEVEHAGRAGGRAAGGDRVLRPQRGAAAALDAGPRAAPPDRVGPTASSCSTTAPASRCRSSGCARPLDGALRALSWALAALAVGLVAVRL